MPTKKETIENPNSAWNLAGPDEEVFVLRATDAFMPYILRRYARYGRRHAMPSSMYLDLMTQAREIEKSPDRRLPFNPVDDVSGGG